MVILYVEFVGKTSNQREVLKCATSQQPVIITNSCSPIPAETHHSSDPPGLKMPFWFLDSLLDHLHHDGHDVSSHATAIHQHDDGAFAPRTIILPGQLSSVAKISTALTGTKTSFHQLRHVDALHDPIDRRTTPHPPRSLRTSFLAEDPDHTCTIAGSDGTHTCHVKNIPDDFWTKSDQASHPGPVNEPGCLCPGRVQIYNNKLAGTGKPTLTCD